MDDFFDEMRDVLSSNSESLELEPSKPTGQSSSYFPNMYAEALVPLNVRKWPSFGAGSAMASDMPDFGDKIKTPFDNLIVAKEYLETSQSDVQWRDRFWQITEDTTAINIASEVGGEVGSFMAGAKSNKIAEGYMNEMVETAITANEQEKLNFEIFKQTAREQDIDASKIRGTGVAREYVPEYMKGEICERPERNARPQSWDNSGDWTDDGICFNIDFDNGPNSNGPKNPSGGVELDLPSSNPDSYSDSSNYPDSRPILDDDDVDRSIFGKIFGFFGFGGGGGSTVDEISLSSTALSVSEIEETRDRSTIGMNVWGFLVGDGGGGMPLYPDDPSHPALNPPPTYYIPPPE